MGGESTDLYTLSYRQVSKLFSWSLLCCAYDESRSLYDCFQAHLLRAGDGGKDPNISSRRPIALKDFIQRIPHRPRDLGEVGSSGSRDGKLRRHLHGWKEA